MFKETSPVDNFALENCGDIAKVRPLIPRGRYSGDNGFITCMNPSGIYPYDGNH
jgi:hypothetical protein